MRMDKIEKKPRGLNGGGKGIPEEDYLGEVPISAMVENASTLQKVKEEPIELKSKNENEKESSKAVLKRGADGSSSKPGGSGLESGNSDNSLLPSIS